MKQFGRVWVPADRFTGSCRSRLAADFSWIAAPTPSGLFQEWALEGNPIERTFSVDTLQRTDPRRWNALWEASSVPQIEREVGLILQKLERLGVVVAAGAARGLVAFAELLLESPTALSRRDRTPKRILEHFEDCLCVFEVLPQIRNSGRIADLGSGNGLPGIVVTLILNGTGRTRSTPAAHEVVLLERSARRAAFLKRACLEVGACASVAKSEKRSFLERLGGGFEVVLARAISPLPDMAGLVVRYLRPEGVAVVWAGNPDAETKSKCADACRAAGLVGKWTRPVELRSRGDLLLLRGENHL